MISPRLTTTARPPISADTSAVLDRDLQLDLARAAHLEALLDHDVVLALAQRLALHQRAREAATAEPVAGSSAIPRPGANMRARNRRGPAPGRA